jgi:uncharacterized protein DUF4956
MRVLGALVLAGTFAFGSAVVGFAQPPPGTPGEPQGAALQQPLADSAGPDNDTQLEQLRYAFVRLPMAAGLACVLALRPRRRGTPHRQPPVVQTQIILAVVGAVVMLVVGTSLARAFGIVGAAGLVRYRARIDDPKDAGVMLSTLAVGLAAGVGLWMLALFATAFILGVLWVIESFEPKAHQLFTLKVQAKDPAALRAKIEEVLHRHRLEFEMRTATQEELCYEVRLPFDKKTDRLSNSILKVDPENTTGVEWEEKKDKKK